jgi:Predicted metal-dependent hydrolase with the TIM-barrel fold
MSNEADQVYINGRFATLDHENPSAEAVAVKAGRFVFVGSNADAEQYIKPGCQPINLKGKRVVPGLHDSHLHLIRGGLNYNMELRWDGVRSLANAMAMLKLQVERTPAPQWVRVVGGFTEHQFMEKRLPTLEELNAVAPDTPVFILHLYDRAMLNRAALRAVGYDKNTPNPPGGEIVRDSSGNPTGLLLARPNAGILYATLAKGPKLSPDDQVNSTRLFMRELNRLGITSAVDAGGGFQNYPEDYHIIEKLAQDGELTIRIAYNLFTQNPQKELKDFSQWAEMLQPLSGDSMYRHNGAGEMLVFSAADFEDFREPRPEMPVNMEPELEKVVRLLAEKRWPFRLHATYDETIDRALTVFERVNKDIPFDGLHWFFDHAETITQPNIDRVMALGGGIAVQHRMAYQGEYFAERYGKEATAHTPPIKRMLDTGLPVGGGTDATRVASYNPWVCLYWMVTGKTLGGFQLYGQENTLDRETALRLWTEGSAWFSNDVSDRGLIKEAQLADFIVPSDDYFSIPEDEIKDLNSSLTIVGGRIVHAGGDFAEFAPPLPKASPNWVPTAEFGGYQPNPMSAAIFAELAAKMAGHGGGCGCGCKVHGHGHAFGYASDWLRRMPGEDARAFWGSFGCTCWM